MSTMKPSKIRKVFNKHVRIGMSFDVTDKEGTTRTLYVASSAFIRQGKEVYAYCADMNPSISEWRSRARALPCGFIISKLFAKDVESNDQTA